MAEQQKRQTAVKIRIASLLQGRYIKEEGWNPDYVLTTADQKVSRANIMAIIVSLPVEESGFQEMQIDDGSGSLAVRTFGDLPQLRSLHIGDIVTLIGKPREFAQQRYILAEIIKKVENKQWVDVRLLELDKQPKHLVEEVQTSETPHPTTKIFSAIKEYDKGDGAPYEEIVHAFGEQGEKVISSLLKEGEIFEVSPGRLKCLE